MALHIPTSLNCKNDYELIRGEAGLDFSARKTATKDYGSFNELFIKKAAQYGWKLDAKADPISFYSSIGDEVNDELDYIATNYNDGLLGSPSFIQYDHRTDEERYAKYDTPLFQLVGFDEEVGSDFVIGWGGDTDAHFFINHDKLKEKDFSDILYFIDFD